MLCITASSLYAVVHLPLKSVVRFDDKNKNALLTSYPLVAHRFSLHYTICMYVYVYVCACANRIFFMIRSELYEQEGRMNGCALFYFASSIYNEANDDAYNSIRLGCFQGQYTHTFSG